MLHWNAHGISKYNRIKEFEYLIEKESIHIASLIETHLNETHKLYLQFFFVYRKDREGARGGGVALIGRKNIQHKLLSAINTKMVDNMSVDVIIKENYSYWETLMLSKHLGTATPITRLETHSSIFNIIEVSLYITP